MAAKVATKVEAKIVRKAETKVAEGATSFATY